MATTSRMEQSLWCYACSRLNHQPRARGEPCARCGSPAAALEAVVDVVDARAFLDSCRPDAARLPAAEALLPAVTVAGAGRDDCAVCLEELEPGAGALATPCGHAYHPRCIARWLAARNTCPLCRARVGAGAGDRDGLVVCSLQGGRRLGLGRRIAGRIFNVRVLDADGNLRRIRARRGFKGMLLHARISVGALFASP